MRRMIACCLIAFLCFGLAACEQNPEDPDHTKAPGAASGTTALPAPEPSRSGVQGNGGDYVRYEGAEYYWELNIGCIEQSGLWGHFSDVPGARRNLMRRNSDGTKINLFPDKGCGGLWLYNGRFYMTRLDEDAGPYAFSASIEGGAYRREIGAGQIFALDEARALLIIADPLDSKAYVYDIAAEQRKDLSVSSAQLLYYDPASAMLFFRDYSIMNPDAIKLSSVHAVTGEVRDVVWIELGDYEEFADADSVEFANVRTGPDGLNVYLAGYGGTAHMYCGSVLLTIELGEDATQRNENPKESDWFGVNKPFTSDSEGPFQGRGGDYYGWYLCPGEGKAPEIVLTEEDLAEVGLSSGPFYGEEDFTDVRDVEYMDGALFFSVWRGPRNAEEDIGWRYAYRFGSVQVYRKDLAKGTIETLYSVKGSDNP